MPCARSPLICVPPRPWTGTKCNEGTRNHSLSIVFRPFSIAALILLLHYRILPSCASPRRVDLWWLYCCDQAGVDVGKYGIVPARGDGGHVEGVAYLCAAAIDAFVSCHCSVSAHESSYANEGCRRLVADDTEFRHCCNRGERGLVADAFDRLQEPLGVVQLVTLTHELHHGVMSFAVSLAQGLQMSRDLVSELWLRTVESRQVSAWIMCLSWSRRAANSTSCSRTASCGVRHIRPRGHALPRARPHRQPTGARR